jgi:ABC-type branched-subunit amino acid transport system substrate-binding protein
VVIKARIPYVSPWASDPTLSRGMIPWFFQLVPDDRRQAAAIVAGADHLVLVADTSYDARHFADAVAAAADSTGATLRTIDASAPMSATDAVHRAVTGPGRAGETRVVLATDEADAVRILERLATLPKCPTVVVPVRLAVTGLRAAAGRCPGRVLAPAIPEARGPAPESEAGEGGRDGNGPAARYTREAVDILVAAIRSAGLDPWRIRDALAEASVDGEAGPVFDDAGRRRGTVRLVELVSLVRPARR